MILEYPEDLTYLDRHTLRAAVMYGVNYSDVTPEQRRLAKARYFGEDYGMGAPLSAVADVVSKEEADKLIKKWLNKFPSFGEIEKRLK